MYAKRLGYLPNLPSRSPVATSLRDSHQPHQPVHLTPVPQRPGQELLRRKSPSLRRLLEADLAMLMSPQARACVSLDTSKILAVVNVSIEGIAPANPARWPSIGSKIYPTSIEAPTNNVASFIVSPGMVFATSPVSSGLNPRPPDLSGRPRITAS